MRSVARSLGRYGITANSVAIALTATPAVERTLNGDPERLKRQLEKYIIRRPGRPDDIANMVQFLASDASPIARYTPKGADPDSVIDVRAVFQQGHRDLAVDALPPVLLPRKGRSSHSSYSVSSPLNVLTREGRT